MSELVLSTITIRRSILTKKRECPLTDPFFYLVVALFSGEATLSYFGIPITYNSSAFYAIFLFSVAIILFSGRGFVVGFHPVFLFYIYLLIRSIFFNAAIFEEWWLPNFVTFLFFFFVNGTIETRSDLKRVINYIYLFTAILMILAIAKVIIVRDFDRLAVFGGPNGFYKFAILFEAFSFCFFLEKKKFFYLFFAAIGVVLAVLTSSKGAIAELLVVLPVEYLYFLVFRLKVRRKIIKSLFFAAILVVFSFAILVALSSSKTIIGEALERGMGLFSGNFSSLTSVSSRFVMLDLSIGYFRQNPLFGMGGMYMLEHEGNVLLPYAHNIFYEMLGEQGIIGFLLVCGLLVYLLTKCKRKILKQPWFFGIVLGALIYFVGSLFSGNILDSKVIFFFIILATKYETLFSKRRYSYIR